MVIMKRFLPVLLMILAFVYFRVNAVTSEKIISIMTRQPVQRSLFFAQLTPLTQTQTQNQTQTQTQTQPQSQGTQTQTQTQTQPQTQPLFIGFPMRITWKFKTNGPVITQPQADDHAVYCASKPGIVYAVSQTGGKQLWKTNLADVIEDAFVLRGGVLYIGTQRGQILALETKKGKIVWTRKVSDEPFQTMPVTDEKNLYFVSAKGTIVAVSLNKGATLWKFKMGGGCSTSPTLEGELVFAGCDDQILFALDRKAGFVKWKVPVGSAIKGSPLAGAGHVFFGTEAGFFYCLASADGSEKWRFKAGGAVRGVPMFYRDPDESSGLPDVLMTALDNFLYDLKIKNGGRRWLATTGSRVFNRMHFDRALIFVAPFGSTIVGYDPHTGIRVGDSNTSNRIRSAPMTANDRLFIGLNNGDLVCLTRTPPPPPEGQEDQTQSQTQTQTVPAVEEDAEEEEAEPETQTETQPESQTQTQSQPQTQTQPGV